MNTRGSSIPRALLVLAALAMLDGCVRQSNNGSQQVFTYELWVPVSAIFAGLAAVSAGWFLRRVWGRVAWGCLLMGPIAVVLFAPSLLRDRVSVDESGFSVRTGIWGLTAVHEVRFDSIRRVRVICEESARRYGRTRTTHYLACERTDGSIAKVPVNNEVCQAAAPHILKAIRDRGIPVVDDT